MANKQAAAAPAGPSRPAQHRPRSGTGGAAPDPVAQLTQLAALRDSGALTEAEFEAQKAKILG